jgi:hypothetical protein
MNTRSLLLLACAAIVHVAGCAADEAPETDPVEGDHDGDSADADDPDLDAVDAGDVIVDDGATVEDAAPMGASADRPHVASWARVTIGNPGFENRIKPYRGYMHWQLWGDTTRITRSSTAPHGGTDDLRIDGLSPTGTYVDQCVPAKANHYYALRAWTKLVSLSGNGAGKQYISLRFKRFYNYDSAPQPVAAPNVTGWTYVDTYGTAPADVAFVCVEIGSIVGYQPSIRRWDDIELYEWQ